MDKMNCARNLLVGLSCLLITAISFAEELTPRRWSHLPIDTHVAGFGYAHTEADIAFDPVLQAEDVTADVDTWVGVYMHSFSLFERSVRVGIAQGYQKGRWKGLLEGEPARADRQGLTDTVVRFSINLYGAPPLAGKAYRSYRMAADNELIVGAGMSVQLPTGDYMDDKLINLGSNRYTFRPQFGAVYKMGHWSIEGTVVGAFYTDNDDFWNDNKLEQDPLYSLRGHLIYDFSPGKWVSFSALHNYGGRSTINGEQKDDEKQNSIWALSGGHPLSKTWGIKFAYIHSHNHKDTGVEPDSLVVALSTFW
ncbi:transporter [Neiella marina]|uniref:Transporter n=1 Tax=Neiella holothuriorum TaxID=2870530 RepID=A0ABS7EC36_9GAMM|nr:transporter [Neiella holothuriorum]MBW8189856.1 transporter [Neiella holothuriorum]